MLPPLRTEVRAVANVMVETKTLFINCTVKRSPEPSNTAGLVEASTRIMEKHGMQGEVLRAIDHDIAIGVWPDMTEHGWATDPFHTPNKLYTLHIHNHYTVRPVRQRILGQVRSPVQVGCNRAWCHVDGQTRSGKR